MQAVMDDLSLEVGILMGTRTAPAYAALPSVAFSFALPLPVHAARAAMP